MKKAFPCFVAALVVPALFAGCSKPVKKSPPAVPVLTATAETTNLPVLINPPPIGHALAFSTVTVHSQVGGMLQAVHFREGQEVKKGDLLFSIDPRPTQAALAQAKADWQRDRAQLEYAKQNFAREQKLFDQKLAPQNELDTARADLDAINGTVAADKAAIANAQLNLQFCEIRAPFDGVTGALRKHEGDVVKAPDDTLLTINQIHPIYVQFAVPERFLPEIKREMKAHPLMLSVSFENMAAPPPQGQLTFINNSVDETTGTIQLRGTFANKNDALWPGQFVTVNLTLSELTNAVVVPTQAVQTGQNGEFIYVVKPDMTVEERPVTAGISYAGETVIEKGLSAGETVVTDGQLRLAPGIKVSVKTAGTTEINSTAFGQ